MKKRKKVQKPKSLPCATIIRTKYGTEVLIYKYFYDHKSAARYAKWLTHASEYLKQLEKKHG